MSPPAVVVAEWLRRWTRNPLGSSRVGSNPADNEPFDVEKNPFWNNDIFEICLDKVPWQCLVWWIQARHAFSR